MSLLTTLLFSSSYSFCFSELRRASGASGRSSSIGLGIGEVSEDILSRNSLYSVFVLLSVAREEDLSVKGLFSTVSDFLSRAREIALPSCFCSVGIIISKLLSVFRSASTIGTASSFFSLLTSLCSNKYNYVPKINRLVLFL